MRLEPWKRMWNDRKMRPILLRYAVPVAFSVVLLLLAALPLISFQTVNGASDTRSLFYWHFANFFGTDGARGAYELFATVDEGNMYYGFYRAVVLSCLIDAGAAVLSFVLTVAFSAAALYLIVTEEKTERSKRVGRIFRVAVGNRWTALIPYALSVIPFAFSKLFAYFSTALRSYDTAARFLLIDPLWIAILFFAIDVVLILRAGERERNSRWNIYCPPSLRSDAALAKKEAEERAWEDEVRADAETDGTHSSLEALFGDDGASDREKHRKNQ